MTLLGVNLQGCTGCDSTRAEVAALFPAYGLLLPTVLVESVFTDAFVEEISYFIAGCQRAYVSD